MSSRDEMVTMGLPRPGKALLWAMGTLLAIWVVCATAINLFRVNPAFMELFAGSTQGILRGEIWRLLTAGLINNPVGGSGVNQIVTVLLGLYFLGPSLEARWGGRRTILFLVGALVTGFLSQLAAEVLLPHAAAQWIGQSYWFGSMAAVEAIAVAWALSNRGQIVRLFFVLPVTSTGLLIFVIGITVLYVLAGAHPPEGVITPFGGMFAGYLFGAGSPTPARRMWLKLRYRWVSKRVAQNQRKGAAHLRVIEGGESTEQRRRPPTDKRFLN